MPIELELGRVPATAGPFAWPKRRRRIGVRERMSFTERLALLLETGVALHAALDTLASQASSPTMRAIIVALHADVVEGKPFSQALARHPSDFPSSYVNLVAAGESGGFVPEVLKQLIDLDDKAERLRSTILSAISYPAFLTVFSVVIVTFILVYVFPQFADLFKSLGDRLPATTALLIGASNFVRGYWQFLLPIAAIACAGAAGALRQPATRAALDHFLLHAPGIRVITVDVYLLQCLRVLALSLANGVSVVDALGAARDVVPNRIFRNLLQDVQQRVSEGQTIAPGFEAAPYLPQLAKQMIATGEQSGRLALVLGKLAELYQRDVERRLATAARLAEPILLALMGAVIGLIVSALLLPIFRLSSAVH